MTSLSLAVGHPTLADRLVNRSLPVDLVLIAAGAAFTAIVSQFQILSWPVALTAQTLAVFLVGSFLGCLRGALSMTLYVLIGALGLPVFGRDLFGIEVLLGPSGGYILAFILAAAFTGWVAQRSWDHTLAGAALSFFSATVVVFALALPWCAVVTDRSLLDTVETGLYPFFGGAVVKAAAAALIVTFAWRKVASSDLRAAERDFASDTLETTDGR
ncbi:biotin transporter BioY [Parafrigoribacterium mesophilum]|uniref:biotin transporter BioY n=1 Tax=Parafrigoribacterium mesophilum TaxID=433646 RepID=UPI0031FD56FC